MKRTIKVGDRVLNKYYPEEGRLTVTKMLVPPNGRRWPRAEVREDVSGAMTSYYVRELVPVEEN